MVDVKNPAKGLLYGGIASCLAEAATMPIDVIKVRMQYSGAGGERIYRSVLHALTETVRKEGSSALFKGISPALMRQSVYGSLRYGLYTPFKQLLGMEENVDVAFHKKLIAGGSAGALASFIANPTDLMKVRLQVDGMGNHARKYNGLMDALRQAVRQEGVLALWKGSGPTVGRATVLAGVEMASYDEVKKQLIAHEFIVPGTISGVFVTSLATGFFAAVASSPFDVVKSRVMGQPVGPDGRGVLYRGMVDCFVKSVKEEGVLSLWKGFFPNWGRLAPRAVVCFVSMEQLKLWFGSE